MIYTDLTRRAMKLCFDAHRDQLDKSGVPYPFHPWHVAEQMRTEAETVVALLHDVLEDTPLTADDLRAMGYPEEVLAALQLLCHAPDTPYMDYVAALKANPIARAVKLADLRHNSDLTRLPEVTPKALERVEKYRRAIALLESDE